MSSETTIGVERSVLEILEDMGKDGQSKNDVIKNLLSLRTCVECSGGEMVIARSYVFEPLYFDLECTNCGEKIERWRVPFRPRER